MGYRRRSRELSMQALFYMDMNRIITCEALDMFCNNFQPSKKVLPFFNKLTGGILKNRSRIDKIIEKYSRNWKLNRMSCVDRNVMRVATFEMLYCSEIPPKVSINEAIDIGKKFGSEESGGFINGILDSIRIAIEQSEIKLPDPEQQDFQEADSVPEITSTSAELS